MQLAEIEKQIEEMRERQRTLVMTKHNLTEQLEASKAAEREVRQIEKELGFLNGALEALSAWKRDIEPPPAPGHVNGRADEQANDLVS